MFESEIRETEPAASCKVVRDVEGLHQAAAQGRAVAADTSANSLRRLLVEVPSFQHHQPANQPTVYLLEPLYSQW